jgi:LysM repeat protein
MRLLTKLLVAPTLAALLLGAARPSLAAGIIHVVQPGEDLYRIGLAYGISWQAIMDANGLTSTVIYVGEPLVIPVAGSDSSGSAGGDVAPAATPTPAPAPAPVPASAGSTYIIQRGDTLWLIGQRFGVTVNQLMLANGIANPNYIYYGLALSIPGAEAGAPPQGQLLSVTGQAQALPLDCESNSAANFAGYFGASINELDFLSKLPASDDPNEGFVGDAHGGLGQVPPNDYGVYAGPVAALLRAYGVGARAGFGLTWGDLQAEIDAGHPVIVWVIGQVGYGTALAYKPASTGHTTNVARFEHTVMLIGYGNDTVTLLDGGAVYSRSLSQFMASWGVLGDMAVLRA